ncbi:MAG: hypothetical protein WC575_00360 [Patescibacteria group bacterium]
MIDESIFTDNNQQRHHKPAKPPISERLTVTAITLSIILVLALVVLQIKALYDVNRYFNPHYQVCTQQLTEPGYGDCSGEAYAWERILLWSYLSGGLFLIYLILALVFRKRKNYTWQMALFRVFTVLTFFATVVMIAYLNQYLFEYHQDIAWYVALGLVVILSIALVIYIERRRLQKKLAGKPANSYVKNII